MFPTLNHCCARSFNRFDLWYEKCRMNLCGANCSCWVFVKPLAWLSNECSTKMLFDQTSKIEIQEKWRDKEFIHWVVFQKYIQMKPVDSSHSVVHFRQNKKEININFIVTSTLQQIDQIFQI